MAKVLNVPYTSMHRDLHNRGIFTHVMNLLPETGKPGPRNVPPLASIEGAGPNPDWDIEAIKQSAINRSDAKKARAHKKANQEIRFTYGPVCLIFVGDQHIGNNGTDYRRMYDEAELINSIPGAYVWQMGDVVDNFIVGKLMAENFKESAAVMEQWVLAKDYFDSFGEKLVAYCGGNHEAWTRKLTGVDYRRDITPDGVLFDGDTIRARVCVGDKSFRVWSRHKWKGYSKYNPTHGNENAAHFDSPDFDVYVGAHLHRGAVSREFIFNKQRKMSILTGTYKVHDDYGIEQGFPEHDASTAVALLLNDTGSMFACCDLLAAKEYMEKCYPDKTV
jgi:hypothetical protein